MQNFPMRVRWLAHKSLMKQSLEFFQNEFAGRIAIKVMQTAAAICVTILKSLDLMVYVVVYFISILVLVATMDWRLSIPFVIWFVFYAVLLKFLIPRFLHVSKNRADAQSVMTGRVVDSYTNIQSVKLFSHSSREADYAKQSMETFLDRVYPQMRLVTLLKSGVWISNTLLVIGVAALGLYFWQAQRVSPGDIAISVTLAMRLNSMAQWIMWEISVLIDSIGTAHDGMEALTIPNKVKDLTDAKPLTVSRGKIEFRELKFAYERANDKKTIFDGLNLTIEAGEKVGLVGPSGAGKSTLVNLLLRFYNVQSGNILIDGQDVARVKQDSLRHQISMVTQDTSLLNRTIRENILYGRQQASEQEMLEAAAHAKAHDFILELSDHLGNQGYDAVVGERGVKLSGGQRQRIAISRVLLKNAPILILDEATSALDSESETIIQSCLYNIMENKTVLAIAHRLSTIAAMDKLVVLDQGGIVEIGTHQQLLANNGLHAK